MLDYQEYTIDDNGYQGFSQRVQPEGNGNGYDRLNGDWATYYKVAKGFLKRVKSEDRQDFLHDLILAMAKVKAKYDLTGKPLTEAGLVRIACYEVADYWRKYYRRVNGQECGQCSKVQKQKCREDNLYRECPKAVKFESLDRIIEDGNGDGTALHELIADDSAIDIIARLDARLTLQGYPHKFVRIAYKKYAGYPLTHEERTYLYRQRKKAQKSIILV
jgi:hypothetical protein